MTYLLLQTDRQEQSHAIKLVDASNQIFVLLQHRLAHSLHRHLRIEIDSELKKVKVWSPLKTVQVGHQRNWCTTAAWNVTTVHLTTLNSTTTGVPSCPKLSQEPHFQNILRLTYEFPSCNFVVNMCHDYVMSGS